LGWKTRLLRIYVLGLVGNQIWYKWGKDGKILFDNKILKLKNGKDKFLEKSNIMGKLRWNLDLSSEEKYLEICNLIFCFLFGMMIFQSRY
jgi:hypothetical protein